MRTRYIATFAETIRTDPMTLAREYLSARDAVEHEFDGDEARAAYVDVLSALGRFQHATGFARALEQLESVNQGADKPSPFDLMRSVAWSFDDGATFPGFTGDTYWNGHLNVWVPAAAWPFVLAELIAGATTMRRRSKGIARWAGQTGWSAVTRFYDARGAAGMGVLLPRLPAAHDGPDPVGMVRDELAPRDGTELRTMCRPHG